MAWINLIAFVLLQQTRPTQSASPWIQCNATHDGSPQLEMAVFGKTVNFSQAERACENGATLATLNTVRDQQCANVAIGNMHCNCNPSETCMGECKSEQCTCRIWVGLKYKSARWENGKDTPGVWYWISPPPSTTFLNWHTGEPTQGISLRMPNCGYYWPSKNGLGDFECNTHLSYLCQRTGPTNNPQPATHKSTSTTNPLPLGTTAAARTSNATITTSATHLPATDITTSATDTTYPNLTATTTTTPDSTVKSPTTSTTTSTHTPAITVIPTLLTATAPHSTVTNFITPVNTPTTTSTAIPNPFPNATFATTAPITPDNPMTVTEEGATEEDNVGGMDSQFEESKSDVTGIAVGVSCSIILVVLLLSILLWKRKHFHTMYSMALRGQASVLAKDLNSHSVILQRVGNSSDNSSAGGHVYAGVADGASTQEARGTTRGLPSSGVVSGAQLPVFSATSVGCYAAIGEAPLRAAAGNAPRAQDSADYNVLNYNEEEKSVSTHDMSGVSGNDSESYNTLGECQAMHGQQQPEMSYDNVHFGDDVIQSAATSSQTKSAAAVGSPVYELATGPITLSGTANTATLEIAFDEGIYDNTPMPPKAVAK